MAIITCLSLPGGNFNSFSVDGNGLLNMDHRLPFPKDMRENMLRAIHSCHAGRNGMLREASDNR